MRYAGNQFRMWAPVRPSVPVPRRFVPTAVRPDLAPNPFLVRHSNYQHRHWLQHNDHDLIVISDIVGTYTRPSLGSYGNAPDNWNQCNLAASQAALNWQTAANMVMQDRLEVTEMREEAKQARAALYRSRQAEHRLAERRKAKENRPVAKTALSGLSPEQFHRQTGEILWPQALRVEAFEVARHELEQLAADHAASRNNVVKSGNREVRSLIEQTKSELREQIHDIPAAEYIAARKFLDGLAKELRSEA